MKNTSFAGKDWKVNSNKMQNYPLSQKKKEICADVKTAQIESKQAIGYPRLALKRQVSSLEHN